MKNYFTFIFGLIAFTVFPALALANLTCEINTSCGSGEVNVLELSSTTNAHAGVPGSGYPYMICCRDVKGLTNSCADDAVVFAKLSGYKNAHIRENTEADYPGANNACMNVNKGTLTIGYQDNNCAGYDTVVVSMAKTLTNSHVGEAGAYTHKICAKYESSGSNGWIEGFGSGGGGSSAGSILNTGVQVASNFIASVFGSKKIDAMQSEKITISTDNNSPVFNQGENIPKVETPAGDRDNSSVQTASIVSFNFLDKFGLILVALGAVVGLIFVSRRLLLGI